MKLGNGVKVILIVVVILSPLSSLIKVNAQEALIVNTVNAIIQSKGERYADSEIWAYYPNSTLSDYQASHRDSSGYLDHNIKLGTQSDFRDGCFELIGTRRTGICEDGAYTLKVVDTDAAGNISDEKISWVERDTVPPIAPVIADAYICGRSLCIDISGEVGTNIYSNSYYIGYLNVPNQQVILLNNFEFDTNYTFSIKLIDKAQNESEVSIAQIHTPALGIGGGQGSESDPWGGKSGNEIEPILFDVVVKKGKGFDIYNLFLPSPILTYINTNYEGRVDLYGYGISKNHLIQANVIFEYMNINEAWEYCQVGKWVDGNESSCIQNQTGRSISKYIEQYSRECGYAIPIYTQTCILSKFANANDRLTKSDLIQTDAQNVMVTFTKANKSDEYLSTFWNDSKDGRFTQTYTVGENVAIGDKIRAHTSIFGDFEYEGEKIDYRGLNQADAVGNMGVRSGWSNGMVVGEKPNFQDVVVSPVKNCTDVYYSSSFGNRFLEGKWEFHDGIDFAQGTGCPIVAAYSGKATTTNWAGNTVEIKHNDRFITKYGHGANYIGEYDRYVVSGEEIMQMGKSGRATGIHLHFTVLDNGVPVNPDIHFSKYFDLIPRLYF